MLTGHHGQGKWYLIHSPHRHCSSAEAEREAERRPLLAPDADDEAIVFALLSCRDNDRRSVIGIEVLNCLPQLREVLERKAAIRFIRRRRQSLDWTAVLGVRAVLWSFEQTE